MTSTAVAVAKPTGPEKVLALLESRRIVVEPFLPRGVSLNRVAAEVYHAIRENPDIARCTAESIVRGVAKGLAWGLEIGELLHLVPFNVKVKQKGKPDRYEMRVKPIADYKGLIELVLRNGVARAADARVVYEHDEFTFAHGITETLEHRPVMTPEARGKIIGAYAIFRLAFGNVKFEFVPIAEIDAIRREHSKKWKDLPESPPWYAIKTAVRATVKLLPKSAALTPVLRVVEEDEAAEFDIAQAEEMPTTVPAAAPAPVSQEVEGDFALLDLADEGEGTDGRSEEGTPSGGERSRGASSATTAPRTAAPSSAGGGELPLGDRRAKATCRKCGGKNGTHEGDCPDYAD